MNKKSSFLVSILAALSLSGCWLDSTEPSGPPDLTMRDLVGCWRYERECNMRCFDRNRGYYLIVSSNGFTYEGIGVYAIFGCDVNLEYKYVSKQSSEYLPSARRFRRADTSLIFLNDQNDSVDQLVAVDPSKFSCASEEMWTNVSKPAGWDSLIKPLP